MKLAYTAAFDWDGCPPIHIAATSADAFAAKLLEATRTWISDSRATAIKALSHVDDADMLASALQDCDEFTAILDEKGALDCIDEMESSCFVTVTLGMMAVPNACDKLYFDFKNEVFTHFINKAPGRQQINLNYPISLS